MFGSFSESERNVITERTTEGRRRKADGATPAGKRLSATAKTERVSSNPPPIVRQIFQLRSEREGLRSIAERLNADDVETKSGGEWHASTVKYVLDNPKYGSRLRHTFGGTAVEKDVERLQIE
jgi:DNA invertase Pin-like site-specific DNA recombinase